jgi:hypothetical protein
MISFDVARHSRDGEKWIKTKRVERKRYFQKLVRCFGYVFDYECFCAAPPLIIFQGLTFDSKMILSKGILAVLDHVHDPELAKIKFYSFLGIRGRSMRPLFGL